jgi:hypothetical protein
MLAMPLACRCALWSSWLLALRAGRLGDTTLDRQLL